MSHINSIHRSPVAWPPGISFSAVQISTHEGGVGKELSLARFQRSVLTKILVAGRLTGFCFCFFNPYIKTTR